MFLEVKVPPLVITVVATGAIWAIARLTPSLAISPSNRVTVVLAIAAVGLATAVAVVLSFRKAQTTVDPTRPEKATSLVQSGVYRFTRNPMYLGLLFILVAWAVLLSSAWALLATAGFVLYMGRFQIASEDRALEKLFDKGYAACKSSVRRWL